MVYTMKKRREKLRYVITEQLCHFRCFVSGLSIYVKMTELVFVNIKYSILEANSKRSVSPVQVL